MSGEENWRTSTDAGDYFGRQNKKLSVADRRPVIRRPDDLGLGPGISAQAIVISDFNDLLATYNGYYSTNAYSVANAPNALEFFIGTTVMDSTKGGIQRFTGLTSKLDYKRIFLRNPSSPESISWGAWQIGSGEVAVGAVTAYAGYTAPSGWMVCDGTSYSATLYPLLYAIIGNAYGGGGGNFNVPDLRDRTIYGAGSNWGLMSTDGLSVSSRTRDLHHHHNLLVTNGGAHNHSATSSVAGVHDHGGDTGPPTGITQRGLANPTGDTPGPSHHHLISNDGNHSHAITVNSAGDHIHNGITLDLGQIEGTTLRGVGMNYIIRHGQT